MPRYRVYHSARFDRELANYDSAFFHRIDKIEDQLAENPYVGDPLNVRWFREKRIGGFRIYFLIYEDLKVVLMVAISGKKDQQKVINTVRFLLDNFRKEIEDLIDKDLFDSSDSS